MTLVFDPTGWAALEWKRTGDPTKIVEALRSNKPLSARARAVLADCIEHPPKKRRGPKGNPMRDYVIRTCAGLCASLAPHESAEERIARVAANLNLSEDTVSRAVYPRAPKKRQR